MNKIRDILGTIVLNAVIRPDSSMGGLTDCYAVPVDDIEAAREALSQPAEVEGWKLVPVEPTQEMLDIGEYYDGGAAWREMLAAAPNPPSAPVQQSVRKYEISVPDGLHPDTADLVQLFATALAEKLYKAEQKYGYDNGWKESDWMDECRAKLLEHLAKGDPRDVANYCAFLWWHNEPTSLSTSTLLNKNDQAEVCPVCNGNDKDAPCAYTTEKPEGCLRVARLWPQPDSNELVEALKDSRNFTTPAHAVAECYVPLPFAILDEEMAALHRFHECVTDGEGYDVRKPMMKRLAEIGLLRHASAGYYELTIFGLSVLNGDYTSQTSATQAAVAAAMRKCAEISKSWEKSPATGEPDATALAIEEEILASIPAEATAALEEYGWKVAHAILDARREGLLVGNDIQAIVRDVLNKNREG